MGEGEGSIWGRGPHGNGPMEGHISLMSSSFTSQETFHQQCTHFPCYQLCRKFQAAKKAMKPSCGDNSCTCII